MRLKLTIRNLFHRLLRSCGLCPLSVLRATQADVRILRSLNLSQYNQLVEKRDTVLLLETELQAYRAGDKGRGSNVHTALSWFYTQHVLRVSQGTAAPSMAAQEWPHYPKAWLLASPPQIKPETL